MNQDETSRPKLLAKFKLISSSCNEPFTFAYSMKVEEKFSEKGSNDQSASHLQHNLQQSEMTDEKINLKLAPLLNSLARINGPGYKDVDARTFLSIKPLPLIWPKSSDLAKSLLKLENSVVELNCQSTYDWMIKRRILVQPSCSNCKEKMTISIDKLSGNIDQFWVCGCGNMKSFQLPNFLSGSIGIQKAFALIYCWSTRDENVETALSVFEETTVKDTYLIYTSLQSLCGRIIRRDRTKLASFDGFPVQIVTVQIESVYILVAMETKTKAIRLASFDKKEIITAAKSNVNLFVNTCRKWIAVPSEILVFEKKFTDLGSFGYIVTYQTKKAFLKEHSQANEDYAGGYIILHMQKMFKNINLNTIDPHSMNLLLMELEWREKYGYDPFITFNNILTHLATDPLKPEATIDRVNADSFYKSSKQMDDDWLDRNHLAGYDIYNSSIDKRLEFLDAFDPHKNLASEEPATKADEYYIDEFFYGWWYPLSSYENKFNEKPALNVLCDICQMNFNKTSICRHLIEHFSSNELVKTQFDFNIRCNHCFRNFTPKKLHLHRELISTKMIHFSCRICCLPFYNRNSYLDHMKRTHWPREAPYACSICKYRSSFQRDIFFHFEKCHSKSKSLICPVCLKLIDFSSVYEISQSVQSHISDHFKTGSEFSCVRCTLTFINAFQIEKHLNEDHGDPSGYLQSCEFIPFRLNNKEVPLSIIATRDELETLNGKEGKKAFKVRCDKAKNKRFNFEISSTMTLICLECKKKILPKHFAQKAIYCKSCKLRTNCKYIAKNHICLNSNPPKYTQNHRSDIYMCSCQRKYSDTNALAKHMVMMKHYSCKYVGTAEKA